MRENIHCFASLDSTNTACRRLAQSGAPDGTVVIARQQTAGRGRMGRHFESPEGLGLYLSILWRPLCAAESLMSLTSLAAVAAMNAIKKVCGVTCSVKWPNDLVLGGKKLAGILTESVLSPDGKVEFVILGIGINLLQKAEDFSPEVSAIATSLLQKTGMAIDPDALAAELVDELDNLYKNILPDPDLWREEYLRACINIGKAVEIIRPDGTRQTAQARDIDGQYGLVVQYPDGGVETLRSGEVSVRGLHGYAE